MDYAQGVIYMQQLVSSLESTGQTSGSFIVGDYTVKYPGKKRQGDYRFEKDGKAPTHVIIVNEIYQAVTDVNYQDVITYLEDVYNNGLNATNTTFDRSFTEKIFWITLQEEINYPQPNYAGRRLPFQRYFEAVLAKISMIDLGEVRRRTNNHGYSIPSLIPFSGVRIPCFYY